MNKMNIAIIIDKKDPAGINIRNKLISQEVFMPINLYFEEEKVYKYDNAYLLMANKILDKNSICHEIKEVLDIDPQLLIFATKHASKSGIPSLTAHTPGNWDIAEMG